MESLDKILSRSGEATPAAATETQEVTTQAGTETAGQTTEQTAEATEGEQSTTDGKPPIGAIRQAEREKATKRYTEQVADFEKKLNDQNQAWERRFGQLLETVKPKADPKPVPDIFENAPEAIRHVVKPDLDRFEQEQREDKIELSRLSALHEYGAELVKEADAAISDAVSKGSLTVGQIQSIPPRQLYQRAIQWHQQQQRAAPDYDEKLKEKHFAEFQQQHPTETVTNGNGQARPAAVMPSNLASARNVGSRNGVPWSGPAPLDQIFAERRQANVFKR